jgi:MFS family permease
MIFLNLSLQVVFNMLSNSITDKVGRKRLIVGSGVAMGVSHTVFGFYYYCHTHEDYGEMAKRMAWIPLVALIIFSIGFALGFASALFVLMSELIPMKIKAHAAGIASIVNHVTNFTVVELYFKMKHGMTEAGTFWFYGAVCFVAAVYYGVLVPETNGKSLQELEEKLTKGNKKPKDAKPCPSCPVLAPVNGKGLEFDNPSYVLTVAVSSPELICGSPDNSYKGSPA